tara:strand:+ start:443 stop:592 length:150 start_codon:yes stop_codon:yes gene_type:complete
MKCDPAWVLISGFFVLGALAAVVIGGGGFFFLSGYHSGLTQCPKPALMK